MPFLKYLRRWWLAISPNCVKWFARMVISFPNSIQKAKTHKKSPDKIGALIIYKEAFSFPLSPFSLLLIVFKILTDKLSAITQFFFNTQQLVVFSDPV